MTIEVAWAIIYVFTLIMSILIVLLIFDIKHMYDQIKGTALIISTHNKISNKMKNENSDIVFFKGCKTMSQIERRHKHLCSIYHPDQLTGDEETFKQIETEYLQIKNKKK